jgi:hypothetical protein
MGLGEQLRDARLSRQESTSQVAAATRIKIQIIEDLEREHFDQIAAPIYGKGFIKLYAEHVGLDPRPLIEEYVARVTEPPHVEPVAPPVAPVAPPPPPAPPKPAEPDLFTHPKLTPDESRALFAKEQYHPDAFRPASVQERRKEEAMAKLSRWLGWFGAAVARKMEPQPPAVTPAPAPRETGADETEVAPWKFVSLIAGVVILVVFLMSSISRWTRHRQNPPPPPAKTLAQQPLDLAQEPADPYLD